MSDNDPRTHYVYRMYDADDRLLYVGCTKDIVARLRNHRNENAHFFGRIKRISQQGPFSKASALVREKRLILELRPDFNSLPDRRHRYNQKKRWITDRTLYLCGGRSPQEVQIGEYMRLANIAYAEAEEKFPGISDSRSPHPQEAL